MKSYDGGPAFPSIDASGFHWDGLSVRDVFAAMAMQGIISACGQNGDVDYIEENVVKMAFGMADAMLAERGT